MLTSIHLISREHINERSSSVEAGEFLHQLLLLVPACQGLLMYVVASLDIMFKTAWSWSFSSPYKAIFYLTFMWPCIVTNFCIIKRTRCTNFSNLLRHETLYVSGSSSAHHQEFIHCTLSTGISHRFVDSFRTGPGWNCSSNLVLLESCLQTCMTYTSAGCTVNKPLKMGRGTARNM